MSLRTPLGRVLGLGSAKDGTAHFWGQRVSGIALALLGSWFVICFAASGDFSHAAVVAEVAKPLNSLLLILLSVTLAYHSQLGVQVVIEDYVHGHGLKIASLLVSRFVHILFAAAAVYAVIRIGTGA